MQCNDRRPKIWLAAMLWVALWAAACAPAGQSAGPGSGTRAETLRIEVPIEGDISDIPRVMALETLAGQGYTIETVTFDDTTGTIIAMERGDLDFSTVNNALGWAAVTQGVEMVTVLDDAANAVFVAAQLDVQDCADLNGKRVGLAGLDSGKSIMLYQYIDAYCPGIEPNYLIISGSSVRMAGLLAGELDATVIDLSDWISLTRDDQTKAHLLAGFASEFPGLTSNSQFVRRAFAEAYPDSVRDIIRAMLEARREIQDPVLLAEQIEAYLEMEPAVARTAAETYLERKMWAVNGGYDLQSVQFNIDFLVDGGSLDPGLQAHEVADLSYLEDVLDEIGRQ